MKWEAGSWRLWLFRGLVAITAGLMIASFIMVWWNAQVVITGGVYTPKDIVIYGYGLRDNLNVLRSYIISNETPLYQTILAWIYLSASAGLILFSTWLKGWKGQMLLGVIGAGYLAYAYIAVFVVVANGIKSWGLQYAGYGVRLQGLTPIMSGDASITTRIWTEYYTTYVAGGLCIALAILRNMIVGKVKPSTSRTTTGTI